MFSYLVIQNLLPLASFFVKFTPRSFGLVPTLALLGEIHLGLQQLQEAEQYARRVIDEEHTSCLPDGLRTLGEAYLRQGKFDEAGRLLKQSLAVAKENKDRILEAYALRALGEFHAACAEATTADRFFQQAAALFHELGLPAELA